MFSDGIYHALKRRARAGLNALAGIQCFQTQRLHDGMQKNPVVLMPWRAFSVFRRIPVRIWCAFAAWSLNALAGIQCFQT